MRILALSDWRTQPLRWINELVGEYNPDLILYCGDDLYRVLPINGIYCGVPPVKIYDNSEIKCSEEFRKEFVDRVYGIIEKHTEDIKHGGDLIPREDYLTDAIGRVYDALERSLRTNRNYLSRPFYCVDGNDDIIFKKDGKRYLRVSHVNIFPEPIEVEFHRHNRTEIPSPEITPEIIEFPFWTDISDYLLHGFHNGIPGIFGIGHHEENRFRPKKEYAEPYGIIVSHSPPYGVLDLAIRWGIAHIGSKKLRRLIELHKPGLVICGHVHSHGGLSTKIDNTVIINIASHDFPRSEGNYAVIDYNKEDFSFSFRILSKEYNIRLVRGLKNIIRNAGRIKIRYLNRHARDPDKEIRKLYESLEVLSSELREILDEDKDLSALCSLLKKLEDLTGKKTEMIQQRLLSINRKKPKIIGKITVDPDKIAYLDIETGLARGIGEPGTLWLIGIMYRNDIEQFLYPSQEEEFIDYIRDNNIGVLGTWTRYDHKPVKEILERENISLKYIDLCARTANKVIWYSYKLHKLYNALFPHKKEEMPISGFMAGLYADHIIIPDKECEFCPDRKELIKLIGERNKEDILQMYEICTYLS